MWTRMHTPEIGPVRLCAFPHLSEVMFHPDLRLRTGGAGSRIGALDARFSSSMPLLAWVACQRSYHTRKPW